MTGVDPTAAAAAATARPVAAASILTRTEIAYDPYLPGRTVELVMGRASTPGGAVVPWSAVVKRTTGPGLRPARRELAAYRDGVAEPSPPAGLRAPRLLAWTDRPAEVEVWLDRLIDVHAGAWAVERFAVAARHIALWNATAAARPLPPGFDSEDAWAERHGQPHRLDEGASRLTTLGARAGAADVMRLLADPGFARTALLIESTPERIDRLATFRQTPLHHDLVRSNLFALPDGSTAAIDWENVGRGPLGVDLAPLVIGSVRRGEASGDDLQAIEQGCLDAYESGLRAVGTDPAGVREAYALALGLRWHVVLGTIETAMDPTASRLRGSRPGEPRAEGLRHFVAVTRHILAQAEI